MNVEFILVVVVVLLLHMSVGARVRAKGWMVVT